MLKKKSEIFAEVLEAFGVPKRAYTTQGAPLHDAVSIRKEGEKWVVFVQERESRLGLKAYKTEEEAYIKAFELLAEDEEEAEEMRTLFKKKLQ